MNLEDLRLGADVVSDDGHKLGTLSRFVINTDSLKVTHIVVDTGILRSGEALWKGGWGLSHDRVVPVGCVRHEDSSTIRITMLGDDFRELSQDFLEEYFEAVPDITPGRFEASDVSRIASSLPGEPGPYLMRETKFIEPFEVDIPDDAQVWRLNPHEKIGEVERVIFDEDTRKMTALVIKRGFLFSKDMVLPVAHLVEVVAGVVRVQIDDAALGALAQHKPAD